MFKRYYDMNISLKNIKFKYNKVAVSNIHVINHQFCLSVLFSLSYLSYNTLQFKSYSTLCKWRVTFWIKLILQEKTLISLIKLKIKKLLFSKVSIFPILTVFDHQKKMQSFRAFFITYPLCFKGSELCVTVLPHIFHTNQQCAFTSHRFESLTIKSYHTG